MYVLLIVIRIVYFKSVKIKMLLKNDEKFNNIYLYGYY